MRLWQFSHSASYQPPKIRQTDRRHAGDSVSKVIALAYREIPSPKVKPPGPTGVPIEEEKQEKKAGGLCPPNPLGGNEPPTGRVAN